MNIIKANKCIKKTKIIKCECCESELEIDRDDIHRFNSGRWYYDYYYVTCLICGTEYHLNNDEVKLLNEITIIPKLPDHRTLAF